MRLKSGVTLQGGKYRIVETLGCGGFGITYLAEQKMFGRMVCIKEFFPTEYYNRDATTNRAYVGSQGSVEMMDRFKRKFIKEAQTIACFDHPNIIPIYDIFEENNTAYYVMKYVDGGSLSDVVRAKGPLSERDAVRYIKGVARALAYIHSRSVNHLDIKPSNIMLLGENDEPILIDFGLAKRYDSSGGQTSTTPVGISHGYAPIEQYKQGGVSNFSPSTDIYSLGATLYYLISGCVPPAATEIGRSGVELPSVAMSSGVSRAISSSMSYWREDRPQTIDAFLALLNGKCQPVAEERTVVYGAQREAVNNINTGVDEATRMASSSMHEAKSEPSNEGDYSWSVLLILFYFLGFVGAHCFYVGRTRDGIIRLLTFGGLGLLYLIDIVSIVSGSFKDGEGRPIRVPIMDKFKKRFDL